MSRNHDHKGSIKTNIVIQAAKQVGHLLAFGYSQLLNLKTIRAVGMRKTFMM